MRTFRSIVLVAALLALAAASAAAQGAPLVVFVDAGASGAGDGSSWPDAFAGPLGLRAALAALRPGVTAEVWVAEGTYLPGAPAEGPGAHFALRDRVALLGGFAGGEATSAERDPLAHPTVLSGDLLGDDQHVVLPPWPIPQWVNVADNAHHVVRGDGVGPSARLDGFVVRRGSAHGSATGAGALLALVGASPVVAACVLSQGDAERGGAVHASGGAPLFTDCTFRENLAEIGAGVWLDGAFDARFERCAWLDNVGGRGVGLHAGPVLTFGPQPLLGAVHVVDGRFEGNRGELGSAGGIGFLAASCTATVERTAFVDNTTHGGGGGAFVHAAEATFDACDFVANAAQGDGGGALHVVGVDGAPARTTRLVDCRLVGNNGACGAVGGVRLELEHCSVVANHLGEFSWPAFVLQAPATVHLAHCIVRDHDPVGPGLAGHFAEIIAPGFSLEGCCVEDWDGSLPGPGNFDLDPLFVDADGADGVAGTADDDLALVAGSPCVDRGHGATAEAPATDFAGAPRHVDRADVPDFAGAACAPRADLGCLELGPDGPWSDLGFALAGAGCAPHLVGSGSLVAGHPVRFDVVQAVGGAPGALVLGAAPLALPLFGGTLWPEPTVVLAVAAAPAGALTVVLPWPAGLPGGFELHAQAWLLDPSAPFGLAATNAVRGTAP